MIRASIVFSCAASFGLLTATIFPTLPLVAVGAAIVGAVLGAVLKVK